MSVLDTFYVLFDSDASKLDKGLGETDKKAKTLIDQLRGVDGAAGRAGASLYELIGRGAGLLGVGLSIGALVAGVRSTAAAYDELGKLAIRFRDTADAVDEFRDAAGLLGITEDISVGALTSLDSAMQDTFLGLGRAKKVFEELGIKVTDAHGKIKPTTAVMGELAEKFKGMERGTQIRVMERLGLDPALLKLFNSDMVNLQKRMADVDKASGFNLDQAVKRSAEFTKASKGLSLEVNTLKMYLEKLSEGFKIAAMPFFTEALATASKYVRMFVDYLMKHHKFMEGLFIAIGGAIAYFLVPAAISGAVAVWAMIAPFVAIGALLAAVAIGFALLYDDIMNFIEGGDSMIGHIVARWPVVGDILKGIGAAFVYVWDIAKAFGNLLVGLFDDPSAAFEQFKSDILAGMNKLIDYFPGLGTVIGMMAEAFVSAGNTVTAVWDAIIAAVQAAIDIVMKGIAAVSSAFEATKSFFGFGNGVGNPNAKTYKALEEGKTQIGVASASSFNSQTSNSINSVSKGNRTSQVTIGKVEVKTAATDAEGISKAIGGSMQAQMRQASSNFDDGVLA